MATGSVEMRLYLLFYSPWRKHAFIHPHPLNILVVMKIEFLVGLVGGEGGV